MFFPPRHYRYHCHSTPLSLYFSLTFSLFYIYISHTFLSLTLSLSQQNKGFISYGYSNVPLICLFTHTSVLFQSCGFLLKARQSVFTLRLRHVYIGRDSRHECDAPSVICLRTGVIGLTMKSVNEIVDTENTEYRVSTPHYWSVVRPGFVTSRLASSVGRYRSSRVTWILRKSAGPRTRNSQVARYRDASALRVRRTLTH